MGYKKEGLAEDREPKQKTGTNIVSAGPSPDVKERQRAAVLDALKVGPSSSVALREKLGVLHVAGRVMELRKRGFKIETRQTVATDADGRLHRCALYVLQQTGGAV